MEAVGGVALKLKLDDKPQDLNDLEKKNGTDEGGTASD